MVGADAPTYPIEDMPFDRPVLSEAEGLSANGKTSIFKAMTWQGRFVNRPYIFGHKVLCPYAGLESFSKKDSNSLPERVVCYAIPTLQLSTRFLCKQ